MKGFLGPAGSLDTDFGTPNPTYPLQGCWLRPKINKPTYDKQSDHELAWNSWNVSDDSPGFNSYTRLNEKAFGASFFLKKNIRRCKNDIKLPRIENDLNATRKQENEYAIF